MLKGRYQKCRFFNNGIYRWIPTFNQMYVNKKYEANRLLKTFPDRGRVIKVWTLVIAPCTYMSQTRDQQRFTISEVADDWHEPMVPQRIMWPHGRRSVGGQGNMSPYFLKWRGRPVFCPPYFFGSRHCNAQHWLAIFTKFSQLILRKIIKILATRCQILRLKCTKFDFGWGSAPDHAAGGYSAPQLDPLAGFNGAYY